MPQYCKRGIGDALVTRLCNYASEHKVEGIFLEVRQSNAAALALYRKAGFKQIALRKNYYHMPEGGNEHAVVMRLELQ